MIIALGQGLLGKSLVTRFPEVIGVSHQECDIRSEQAILALFSRYKPDYIINCAGVVPNANADPLEMLQTNTLGPRILSRLCSTHDCRLIHISTDCVFSGTKGKYSAADTPDPTSLYGMSKYLGEVLDYNHVTFRTSFIGYPDSGHRGLLSWFARQNGPVGGYTRSLWNGVTTPELAQFIMDHLDCRSGLWHVANRVTISKYELLVAFNELYNLNKQLYLDNSVVLDRTLQSDFEINKSYYTLLTEMKSAFGDVNESLH